MSAAATYSPGMINGSSNGGGAPAGEAGHAKGSSKPTSLLTSMLGRSSGPQPTVDGNGHGAERAVSADPGAVPAVELDRVLDTWERAWMGVDVAGGAGPAAGAASGTFKRGSSPQADSKMHDAAGVNGAPTSSAQGPWGSLSSSAPSASIHAQAAAGGHSSAIAIGGSIGARSGTPVHPGMAAMPPLPATPPPHHRPLAVPGPSLAHPAAAAGGAGEEGEEAGEDRMDVCEEEDAAGALAAPPAMPLPATPPPHRALGATPVPASRAANAKPINVHHPQIPKNAKDSTDFASVFFSPLPYSYLAASMARSDSAEHLLVNSVGSPDVTLRGGRLAASTTITHHVDWPVDVDVAANGLSSLGGNGDAGIGGQSLTSLLSGGGTIASSLGTSVSHTSDDVTTHGGHSKRASSGSPGGMSALGLVQQALKNSSASTSSSQAAGAESNGAGSEGAAQQDGGSGSSKDRPASISPDSVLASGAEFEEGASAGPSASPAAAASAANGGTATAASAAAAPSPSPIAAPAARSSSGGLSGGANSARASLDGPSILLRPASPRPKSPAPPFSAHPAVASIVMADGGPLLPGMDLLQASGVSSIAAAVDKQASGRQGAGGGLNAFRLVAAAAMIPHVDKADKGGEDAYCIVNQGLGSIGVADGVSGWAEEGIDPAEYSRTLMRFCAEALHEAGPAADAREVIRYAHNSTVMPGSSTVCLALMKPSGKLEVANLGDSGVRVVRNGQIIFASAAQQHMFNMPFQLSHPSIIESPDDADSADVTLVDVQHGDIVILATDGLYDNMFDDEIAQFCTDAILRRRRSMQLPTGDAPPSPDSQAAAAAAAASSADPGRWGHAEAEQLAQQIARQAHRYAQDPYQRTPWSVSSCEQGFAWARFFAKGGGKMDDCTVIVAFVQKAPAAEEAPAS